jgi:lambda family phage portal protein
MDRFATAEVDAAVNSATMALFARMEADAFGDLFDEDARKKIITDAQDWDGTLQSGRVTQLLPGEEIQSPTPGRPNPEFDPFFAACLKQIGIGLNIPFEVLAKHFSASYSAARAALLDAWRMFKIRRTWMADNFCQPIYEEWFAEAATLGRVEAPGFFADPAIRKAWCASSWSGDGPGAIDPEKEVNAAEKRMAIGLTDLATEKSEYDGKDWEAVHAQRVIEVTRRRADGLEQDPAKIAEAAANRPQPRPPA